MLSLTVDFFIPIFLYFSHVVMLWVGIILDEEKKNFLSI